MFVYFGPGLLYKQKVWSCAEGANIQKKVASQSKISIVSSKPPARITSIYWWYNKSFSHRKAQTYKK